MATSNETKRLYLLTGATGHVGTVLLSELLKRDAQVRILVLPGEVFSAPPGVEVCYGDVTQIESLRPFFERSSYGHVTLIHCAAFITIASKEDSRVWDTNVNGTRNVLQLAEAANIERVIYVSSVHAIPERPLPEIITEVTSFSPDLVYGQYAKSKAAAAQIALDYAERGMNVSVVHPSGIIGPGDTQRKNHMIRTIAAMAAGKIPAGFRGGYDFVDSRDVADGILACAGHGGAGECYILSGHYVTVQDLLNTVRKLVGKRPAKIELPYGIVRALAPVAERFTVLFGNNPPLFTPYSVYTLHTNGFFSHEKATQAFGYRPRELEDSLQASL